MGIGQRRIIERGAADAGASPVDPDPPPRKCCTVVAQSWSGAQVWVQMMAGTVNVHYPFASDPAEQLRVSSVRLPAGLDALEWEAGSYATFSLSCASAEEVAFFVDQLFTQVLGCDDAAYEPHVMTEALDR